MIYSYIIYISCLSVRKLWSQNIELGQWAPKYSYVGHLKTVSECFRVESSFYDVLFCESTRIERRSDWYKWSNGDKSEFHSSAFQPLAEASRAPLVRLQCSKLDSTSRARQTRAHAAGAAGERQWDTRGVYCATTDFSSSTVERFERERLCYRYCYTLLWSRWICTCTLFGALRTNN